MTRFLAHSLRAYPLVGLCLGLLANVPFFCGLFTGSPLVQGWFYTLLLLWLTRGLHWDGLADLADAWGSGSHGERFWEILKDSRLGAFGALGLLFALFGFVLLAGELCATSHTLPLILAPLAGRCTTAPLLRTTPVRQGSTLALLIAPGASTRCAALHSSLALILGFATLGLRGGGAFLLLAGLGGWSLRRLALSEGGLNGDMLGTAILGGELAFLAAALC